MPDAFTLSSTLTRMEEVTEPLAVTVTDSGLIAVAIGTQLIADGAPGWTPTDARAFWPLDQPALGAPLGRSVEQKPGGTVCVTQAFAGATFESRYLLNSEDLHIDVTVHNHTDAVLGYVGFRGLTVHMGRPSTAMPRWLGSYSMRKGVGIMFPAGKDNPAGAKFLECDGFGLGLNPTRVDFLRHHWDMGGKSEDTSRELFHFQQVNAPPGGSATFGVVLRFSRNTDWKHLCAPYKTAFRARFPGPGVAYPIDGRYVGKEGLARTPSPDNPLGLKERLDQPARAAQWAQGKAAFYEAAGAQGVIIWDPYGSELESRGAHYRTDAQVLPPAVAANLPAIAAAFAAKGLWLGSCARPGQATERWTWTADVPLNITPETLVTLKAGGDEETVPLAWARLRASIAQGLGGGFYFDTFGGGAGAVDDARTLVMLAPKLGTTPRYTENPHDLMAPFGGFYANVKADPQRGIYFGGAVNAGWLEWVRWLTDADIPVIVQNRTGDNGQVTRPILEVAQWCLERKLSLLIGSGDAAALNALQGQYLNADGTWK